MESKVIKTITYQNLKLEIVTFETYDDYAAFPATANGKILRGGYTPSRGWWYEVDTSR